MEPEGELLREALVAEVSLIKDEYIYPDLGRAFQHWAAVNVLGIEDKDVADELTGAMGSDGGIDYFHVNEDNKTVEIMQAKFSENRDAQVDQKAVLEFYDIPRKLLTNNTEYNSRFREQHETFKRLREQKYTTRLFFVTTASVPDTIREIIGLKDQNMSSDTTFDCFEIKDLIAYVGNPNSPSCELGVSKNECFVGRTNNTQIRRMVATVSASELKKVYKSIGSPTLFSLNPRSYLGGSSKPTKGIKKTILEEPEKLWHYNNGISAVCESFEYKEETGIVKIYNLKIVNGCQTVTTIGKTKDIDPSAELVLRLSETNDTTFSENISKYTNSQNSIKSPDLLSNHAYLINLEKRFETYNKFVFERKKGQEGASGKRVQSKRGLYVIKSVGAARLKMAYSLKEPNLSIQLSDAKIFTSEQTDSSGPWYFAKLFEGADPRDFIVPHTFFHLLNLIKKRAGDTTVVEKNIKFLLKYRIGQYYIIGMIGEIFDAMDEARQNSLRSKIVECAVEYDAGVIDKISSELKNLVDWIAHEIPHVVGDNDGKPLHEQKVYYLRDPLRKQNMLPDLYHKRESWCKLDGRRDPFESRLCEILGIS